MKNFKFLFIINLIFSITLLNSCKDDDPIMENDEEVITTLTYTLTPTSGDIVTLSFVDLDGNGGNAPTITGGTLQANMVYTGTLDLKNESISPSESITAEIAAEKEDHQLFFATSGGLDLVVAYSDQDADGKPVGLTSSLTTGSASTGGLIITLRHQPNKSASEVSNGDISNAGGETDIEVTFDVTIQ